MKELCAAIIALSFLFAAVIPLIMIAEARRADDRRRRAILG